MNKNRLRFSKKNSFKFTLINFPTKSMFRFFFKRSSLTKKKTIIRVAKRSIISPVTYKYISFIKKRMLRLGYRYIKHAK